jgi:hypothetical protein
MIDSEICVCDSGRSSARLPHVEVDVLVGVVHRRPKGDVAIQDASLPLAPSRKITGILFVS